MVNIQDDLTGFMSTFFEHNHDIYQLKRGLENQYKNSVDDPMNKFNDDMVFYLNVVMDDQGTVYTR